MSSSNGGFGIKSAGAPRRQAQKPRKQHRNSRPGRSLATARFGNPQRLFKDSDKDGVPNVFDCQPFNKKKQDVISPSNYGGGMRDMYSRREGSRQNRRYFQQMREAQRLEMLRLEELRRIGQLPVQVVDNSRTIYQDVPFIRVGDKMVSMNSKEGQAQMKKDNAAADAKKNAARAADLKVARSSVLSANDNFMESMGYQGTSTAFGTTWTLPAKTSSVSSRNNSGSSRNNSGGGSSNYTAPTNTGSSNNNTGSSNFARIIAPKPSPLFSGGNQSRQSTYRAPAPKKSVVSRVVSWFRRK